MLAQRFVFHGAARALNGMRAERMPRVMPYLLNLIYLTAWLCMAPWLCWQAWVRKKSVRGLSAKWFGSAAPANLDHKKPVVWFHGVSVGEIHLLRQVVARFRERFPHWQCMISTTTATGYDEACKHFAELPVIFWPFDFTWASNRRCEIGKLVVLSEGRLNLSGQRRDRASSSLDQCA